MIDILGKVVFTTSFIVEFDLVKVAKFIDLKKDNNTYLALETICQF
jgi:hypothetical protein